MRNIGILILVFSAIFVFDSCTLSIQEAPAEPPDLIQRDTMVDIIVDLRLLDAIIIIKQRQGDNAVGDQKYFLNKSILAKYNITREQFDNSFYYYENDLKVLDAIYADAITKLTLMKGESEQEE